MAFNQFPYSNFHELNLDWILQEIKSLNNEITNWEAVNTITFRGEWSITTQYPAWSIVSVGNMGYVSLQPVPKGIAISNTAYWALVADYTALIANLQKRVVELEQEVANITPGTNIVFFGDSWTVGTGAGDPDTPDRYNKRFSTLVANALGLTQFNFAVGGAGFAISGNTIGSQITIAADSMTAVEINNTAIVVISGGVNDLRHIVDQSITYSAFLSGIKNCVNTAVSQFPKAKIYVYLGNYTANGITPTWQDWISSAERALQDGVSRNVTIVPYLGAAIDGLTSNYISDTLHPNPTGHRLLANYIINTISGAGAGVDYVADTVTFTSGFSAAFPVQVYRKNNDVVINPFELSFTSDITSNTVVGNITSLNRPITNLYVPVYKGNIAVGSCAITASGAVRVIPNSGVTISSSCYIPGFRYSMQSANVHN